MAYYDDSAEPASDGYDDGAGYAGESGLGDYGGWDDV
jgi:hypothetical protein